MLLKEVYEILRAKYSSAFIVKCGSNPFLSFSNPIGSCDSIVVDNKVRAPFVSMIASWVDISIYTNVYPKSLAVEWKDKIPKTI